MKEKKGHKGKYLFGTVKVGEKGQIVIPKDARDKYNIRPGDTVMIMGNEKGIALMKNDMFISLIGKVLDDDSLNVISDNEDKHDDSDE